MKQLTIEEFLDYLDSLEEDDQEPTVDEINDKLAEAEGQPNLRSQAQFAFSTIISNSLEKEEYAATLATIKLASELGFLE